MFVYGTLREGYPARSMVVDHIAQATPATMNGRIFALPTGYPAMIDDTERVVVGEVIQLVDLAAALPLLDAYEGDEFNRVLKKATLSNGTQCWTWCYLISDESLVRGGTPIASGDWVDYDRKSAIKTR